MPKIKNKRKSKKLKEKKSIGNRIKEAQVRESPVSYENMPIVFSWVTLDFIRKPLTEFYYIAAAVGAMGMISWGIYNRNFVMVITFIMMVIVIILALNEEPKKINVKISEKGIDLNDEHYDFNEFKSYKISRADDMPILVFKQRKSLSPFRTIYIENEPINDLENFLGIYLEKEEEK